MAIIRVFPRKTSLTPEDDYSFIGDPPLWIPEADEVHISVTFTWDIKEARRLYLAWRQYHPIVKIGGPAFGDRGSNKFVPGMYLKEGVTFTSRGCNNNCGWCLVKTPLKLLPITPGWIVQDDNILQCPKDHLEKAFDMFRDQNKGIKFSGGLEASLINDYTVSLLKSVPIFEVYLAADHKGALNGLEKAVNQLSFLSRDKIRCYVLIGYKGETIEEATKRLEAVWNIGCLPFSQLYQPPDKYIEYPKEWTDLNRNWSRPAITKSIHKEVI